MVSLVFFLKEPTKIRATMRQGRARRGALGGRAPLLMGAIIVQSKPQSGARSGASQDKSTLPRPIIPGNVDPAIAASHKAERRVPCLIQPRHWAIVTGAPRSGGSAGRAGQRA